MTRITNFGIKRTYVQAGFHAQGNETVPVASNPTERDHAETSNLETELISVEPRKKKRRLKKSKTKRTDIEARSSSDIPEDDRPSTNDSATVKEESSSKAGDGKPKKKIKKDRKARMISASEARRLNRIKEKLAHTTCFACREKGHAAKDCPKAIKTFNDEGGQVKKAAVVGICYRCGSKKHTLSKCKKPNNPTDPYPFASCFICNGKGHLASSCLENKSKGIYPNGGCCKLCGETTHLARNCARRQTEANDPTVIIGTAREAGADEDDFHAFKRTTAELDLADKREEKARKMLEIKKGALSGTVVKLGNVPLPSTKKAKVVVFK